MFRRNITTFEVKQVIENGQIIKEYPEDKPYPSCLILGKLNGKIIHVVLAINLTIHEFVIITAYIPDPEVWKNDFKTKK
jgi:hypothetical protein